MVAAEWFVFIHVNIIHSYAHNKPRYTPIYHFHTTNILRDIDSTSHLYLWSAEDFLSER